MAPEVVVPANFGKHHLKSRTHNNLELLCAEGEVQRANSMILSLNSSVIEDLIARLEITSLDMQDFAAPAVNCFVESMYSGELENCDKTNFRDLNKMGHVFDVTWFVERCMKYFTELVDKVTGKYYEDVFYVVEEAVFVENNLKKCDFMDLVIEKLNEIGNKKSIFLKQYAADLDRMSVNQVETVVKIAGLDVGILASILNTHLEKSGALALTETTRCLFQNIDFVKCFANRRYFDVTHNLINVVLDGSFNEDFKCAVKWISGFSQPKETAVKTTTDIKQYPVMLDLPISYFLELDWQSLCDFLSRSDKVCNLYQFFDAIYTWLFISKSDASIVDPRLVLDDDDHVKDIIDIKQDRCWAKISRKYLESMTSFDILAIGQLIKAFLHSDELSSDHESILFKINQNYSLNRVLGTEDLTICLVSEEEKIADCDDESKCGIMLKRTAERKDGRVVHFSFEVVQKESDEANTDIHLHDLLSKARNFNILMIISSTDGETATPLPFNCNPSYDSSSRHWHWGFHQFSGFNKLLCKTPFAFTFANDVNPSVNLIVVPIY